MWGRVPSKYTIRTTQYLLQPEPPLLYILLASSHIPNILRAVETVTKWNRLSVNRTNINAIIANSKRAVTVIGKICLFGVCVIGAHPGHYFYACSKESNHKNLQRSSKY